MKKSIATITTICLILLAWLAAHGQQFTTQTNTIVSIPAVIWRGTNAQIIASQLLNITNTDGSPVIMPGMMTNRSSVIIIKIEVGTNGVLKSIRARIQ